MQPLKESNHGFTLLEILLIVALLAILLVFFLGNNMSSLKKAYDSKRKEHLDKIKISLQEYYSDKQCYPKELECNQVISPYFDPVPCDPQTNKSYRYVVPDGECPQWFTVYTRLQMDTDPDITKAGCTSGCGPIGEETHYNWGVSSSNVSLNQASVSLPSPSASNQPQFFETPPSSCPSGQYTACSGNTCGFYDPNSNSCSVYFCGSGCNGGCTINHIRKPEKQCNP
jgi:general secretion pathway protein G